MEKFEFICIIIEMVFIIIEIGLTIFQIIENKKTTNKLNDIQTENKFLERILIGEKDKKWQNIEHVIHL